MCDRHLALGAGVSVAAMTASVTRAAALAWLGIEPWFVRKLAPQRGFVSSVAVPQQPRDASALLANPVGFSVNPVPSTHEGEGLVNQAAGAACSEPIACITPIMPPAACEIVFFAAPEAAADVLWLNIQRCIPSTYTLRQCAAASGAETRIELGAEVWLLNTLREHAAEKKRLWRLLVGIAV